MEDPQQKTLSARLTKPELSPREARDGFLASLCLTNRTVLKGGKAQVVTDSDEHPLDRMVLALARHVFKSQGADFEIPTLAQLQQTKETLDQKLKLAERLPALKTQHDAICQLLWSKVPAPPPAVETLTLK